VEFLLLIFSVWLMYRGSKRAYALGSGCRRSGGAAARQPDKRRSRCRSRSGHFAARGGREAETATHRTRDGQFAESMSSTGITGSRRQ
jgi:hypothetical protein